MVEQKTDEGATLNTVNGRYYPLWQQFIDKKDQWIGGTLVELTPGYRDSVVETTIVDITLEPNGEDSAFFSIEGVNFSCGFDTEVGGIAGIQDKQRPGGLWFSGYGGHRFGIYTNTAAGPSDEGIS